MEGGIKELAIYRFEESQNALSDAKLMFEKCEIDHGVVTWCDGEVDCAPEFMYEHSFEYVHSV